MTNRRATPARATLLAGFLAALAGLVLAAAIAAPRADAVSASTAIRLWSEQRQMHGLPAGLVHHPELSERCRKHNNYSAKNNYLGHEEDESNPYYTPEGDAAAGSSVLGVGAPPWNSLQRNPWENAPIHLSQMLDPSLRHTGYDESQGYECATTLTIYMQGYGPRPAPKQTRLFTYPGPGVRHYRAQAAREGPFTPGELVGIPQGTKTGPYLYVLLFPGAEVHYGETARITGASLRSPAGRKLAVKVIDERDDRIAPYIPPGGFIIPRKPLRAGKRYTAHVRVAFAGETFKRTWRFKATRRTVGI